MSTYRERREARADRLREWSGKREAKSASAYEQSRKMGDAIPFGQPILAGHHSERSDRRYRARIDGLMDRSLEDSRTAERMADKAAEIDRQAANAIYDDDPDALDRLREKLAALEAERESRKQANAAYRKTHRDALRAMSAYERGQAVPFPSYSIQNLGGRISQARDRIKRLERERAHGPVDRMIFARFAGECADCGAAIEKDQRIRYSKQQGARCSECQTHQEAS